MSDVMRKDDWRERYFHNGDDFSHDGRDDIEIEQWL